MSIQRTIHKIWYPNHNTPFLQSSAILLSPPALLYRSLIFLRNSLYDRKILKTYRLSCPVVSVGNITVGGTGKTPTVIMIAEMLASKGRRPAILSRGYAGLSRSPVNIVSDGHNVLMQSRDVGDEPVLMAGKLPGIPVLTGPQRLLAGKAAIDKFGIDVIILDDAFQHRQVHRDVNILLLDGRNPIGNGCTLPAGPLREPIAAIRRADVVIMTGMKESLASPRTSLPWNLEKMIPKSVDIYGGCRRPLDLIQGGSSDHTLPLESLPGKRICAFAGIASPESLRNTLQAAGGDITSFLAFPDHHRYTEKDIYAIRDAAQRGQADLMITTEKDGVKLDGFPDFIRHVYLLRIAMEINVGQDDFTASILTKIASWKKQITIWK
jgi:tetraacyldisaccharide 4'-kinase